ncbi:probable cyclic nucleotide-gated ion channel 5 [Cryptomeria japonica]|uniref:probable cyclic nucleotide-gated ion channel 5 n=1 Tax=Cryptomeria japonica TaxID=3369 RepID=UPI0027D9CF82|nr:probable cyclic nucleotide-gated ion channel 5 [Cryptomeria japonica]
MGSISQRVVGQKEKTVSFYVDSESKEPFGSGRGKFNKYGLRHRNSDRISSSMSWSVRRVMEKRSQEVKNIGHSLRIGVSRVVFPEDLKLSEKRLFDPQDKVLQRWNKFFIISCIVAVFVDPLFFYLPLVDNELNCLDIDKNLALVVTILRSLIDIFYIIHMALQFRTAFTSPSSMVFGRGELVMDPIQIAKKYLSTYFIIDFLAVLPLPQVIIWIFVPKLTGSNALYTKNALRFIIFLQYLPRFFRMFPLNAEVVRTSGRFNQTAWAGAVYNLLLFVLASHVVGACWYLFALDRMVTCWKEACEPDNSCILDYVYCGNKYDDGFNIWRETGLQELSSNCTVNSDGTSSFNYGIYNFGLRLGVVASRKFVQKYFFCLFWGLQQLSTLCQGLSPTQYFGEEIFSISIIVLGLILMALLIGNMQTYLQSLTIRLEEMRLKRTDTEQWMHRRSLPEDLRQRVRLHGQHKWIETRGVDEEHLIQNLPKDLRRDIKRHLCLDLVKQVHLFKNMDDCLLDAICERLKTSLYTEDACIVREGEYIDEMLFIIQGQIESVTTNGGRIGFFNHVVLKQGDFCGEELLTWALDPKSGASLPSSTRTVKALSEVEVFSLRAEDLKFVATQFRRLHSKQVQHTFRFHSQHWRTWAACFIQATWRSHCRRKHAEYLLSKQYKLPSAMVVDNSTVSPNFKAAFYASYFATDALHGMHRNRNMKLSEQPTQLVELQKPPEPDFSAEDYE